MALSIKPVMHLVLVVSSYFPDDWWENKYPFHEKVNKHKTPAEKDT
jgi:hypothetical protein